MIFLNGNVQFLDSVEGEVWRVELGINLRKIPRSKPFFYVYFPLFWSAFQNEKLHTPLSTLHTYKTYNKRSEKSSQNSSHMQIDSAFGLC